MSEIDTTISDIKLFIQRLKADLPEVFAGELAASAGKVLYKGDVLDARIELAGGGENTAFLEDKTLVVKMKDEHQNPAAIADEWLKEQAKQFLPARTKEWAAKMAVEYNNIVIKDQKTMWGSCSDRKNINFSYRIIKMPEVIIDYLIIHELSHLVHMNHGQDYWSLVSSLSPDYNKHRKWLNDNKGSILADTDLKYIKEKQEVTQ